MRRFTNNYLEFIIFFKSYLSKFIYLFQINGEYSNNLQEVDLTVYPQEACQRENWMVTNTHICTFTKGKGPCEVSRKLLTF